MEAKLKKSSVAGQSKSVKGVPKGYVSRADMIVKLEQRRNCNFRETRHSTKDKPYIPENSVVPKHSGMTEKITIHTQVSEINTGQDIRVNKSMANLCIISMNANGINDDIEECPNRRRKVISDLVQKYMCLILSYSRNLRGKVSQERYGTPHLYPMTMFILVTRKPVFCMTKHACQ